MNTSRILFTVFAASLALATPGLAQLAPSRTSVMLSAGNACNGFATPAFTAISLAEKVSAAAPAPGTGTGSSGRESGPGTLSFDDIVLTKSWDDCSVSLYTLLFKQQRLQTVQISVHNSANTEVLRLTLSDALITSISDMDAVNTTASERMTLYYDKIVAFDPVTNKSACFNRLTNSAC